MYYNSFFLFIAAAMDISILRECTINKIPPEPMLMSNIIKNDGLNVPLDACIFNKAADTVKQFVHQARFNNNGSVVVTIASFAE